MINFCLLEKLERVPLGARSFSPCDADWASAGGSVFNGLLNLIGVGQTNKTNQQINQANLAWQREALKSQQDYNTMMWSMNNEYNTIENQVARMEQGGVNPAMALSNLSSGSGTAQSSPSAGSPSSIPAQAPNFDQFGNAFKEFFAGKMMEAQLRNLQKQGDLLEQQTNTEAAKASVEEANARFVDEYLQARNRNAWEDLGNKNWSRLRSQSMFPDEFTKGIAERQQAEKQLDVTDLTIRSMAIDNKARELNLANLPKQLTMDLQLKAQQIRTEMSVQGMNAAAARNYMESATKTALEAAGVKFNNKQAQKLSWFVFMNAAYETSNAQIENYYKRWEKRAFDTYPKFNAASRNMWNSILPVSRFLNPYGKP